MTSRAIEPLRIPEGFWRRADVGNALRTRDIGVLFRLVRQWTGASQTQIGFVIGVEQGYVSKVMNGHRAVITIELLERIANGFGMPDDNRIMLGLAPRDASWLRRRALENDDSENNSMAVDSNFEASSIEPSISLSSTWQGSAASLPDGSSHRVRRIGIGDIDLLLSARGRYEQMYRVAGGVPARTRMIHFLNEHASPMLRADYDAAIERKLLRAVGSLVALAGVCAYDAGRQVMAERHFFDALRMATTAGDKVLEGHVFALLANQALRTGALQKAVRYAEAGLDLGIRNLTPALRADLYCLTAEAHAQLGNAETGFTNMSRAVAEIELFDLGNEPPETRHLTAEVVFGRNAVMHRQLGRLQEAQRFFDQAKNVSNFHPRAEVNHLAGQVDFLIAAREYAHAASVGLSLLSASAGMESWLVRARIKAAMDRLSGHMAVPEIREFCEAARRQLLLPL